MQLISCKQKHLFLNKAKKDSFFKNPARDLDHQFNLNMTWSLRNRYLRFFDRTQKKERLRKYKGRGSEGVSVEKATKLQRKDERIKKRGRRKRLVWQQTFLINLLAPKNQ